MRAASKLILNRRTAIKTRRLSFTDFDALHTTVSGQRNKEKRRSAGRWKRRYDSEEMKDDNVLVNLYCTRTGTVLESG